MNTKNAFLEMLKNKGLAKKLDIPKCDISIWKSIAEGKNQNKKLPSIEKMEKLLILYGAEKAREEEWTF